MIDDLQFENEQIKTRLERWKKAANAKLALFDEMREALKRLAREAMTTGGVAGRDESLCREIDNVVAVLSRIDAIEPKEAP